MDTTSYQDLDGCVYQELEDFLPEKIFDAHIHLWAREHLLEPFTPLERRVEGFPMCTHEEFSLEDLKKEWQMIFPSRDCQGLLFGMVDPRIHLLKNNHYISECAKERNFYGLMMPPLEASKDELYTSIKEGGFIGFKPYWTFFKGKFSSYSAQNGISLDDFVKDVQWQVAHENSLILLIHVPGPRRIAQREHLQYIVEKAKRYPQCKIILPHVAGCYDAFILEAVVQELKDLDNVYFDLSVICEASVFTILFHSIPIHRILFGTDFPFGLMKEKKIVVNNEYIRLSNNPKLPWTASTDLVTCTYIIYEQLRAMRTAGKICRLSQVEMENIFYHNGMGLFQEVKNQPIFH